MNIVLVEPEIPPNTGNVARLCAATKSVLHLIEPFGFKLDDAQLKRAGMDYWQQLTWHRWKNWNAFLEKVPANARLWFVESNGPKLYSDAGFLPEAKEECDNAMKIDNYHKNIITTIARFNQIPEIENNGESSILQRARPVSDFYVKVGRAMCRMERREIPSDLRCARSAK